MLRRLAPVLVAGLVVAACGSGSDDPSDATPAGAPATAPDAATADEPDLGADPGSAVVPADAPEALRFSSPLVGGGDIELTTLAGRPVLLWFWAPW